MNGLARTITVALGGGWCGSYGSARCPAHQDRSPSLSLRDGDDGRLLVKCHAGCDGRDVLAALRGLGLLQGRRPSELPRVTPATKPTEEADEATRTGWALGLWAESRDPRGTLVEAYFAGRCLDLPDDVALGVLRYHPRLRHAKSGTTWPAMVALLRDLRTDQPTGIHRTFLRPDGSGKAPVEKPKLMLGRARNAAIKLDDNENVTLGLVVTEGIETALAARILGFKPTWALGSATAITGLPLLPGVEALTICGEADESGANARAVKASADRWIAAGAQVSVVEPDFGDLNDVLVARRAS